MFCCKKNKEKIEGMASWLILGGVIPLAVDVVGYAQQGMGMDGFDWLGHTPYLWMIAMGAASLLVKRASPQWRLIVSLGLGGLLAAGMNIHGGAQSSSLWNLLWLMMAMLFIVFQYRHDMKGYVAQTK